MPSPPPNGSAHPTLSAAAHLVASVRAWTVADIPVAERELDAARRSVAEGTPAAAHCDLAQSRSARMRNETTPSGSP